jgi:hypothetical protein
MLEIRQSFSYFCFFISVFLGISLYTSDVALAGNNKTTVPEGLENLWNPSKYISIDEIKPGMDAYCLTEYGTAGVEKFSMEVVDIVRNMNTGTEIVGDIILVKGTNEEFIRTGPVAGCSGSPLYIDGRLAGALAFTWTYTREPLYGVTPIEKMLRIGQANQATYNNQNNSQTAFVFNSSEPVNLGNIYEQHSNSLVRPIQSLGGANPLPCPLITSGIPSDAFEQFKTKLEPYGIMVVSGGGSGDSDNDEHVQLTPGATLLVPLVDGDIQISTFGTVTEVVDDKVYGFGHHLLGQGSVDLPMATGKVHTVVSNTVKSFKLASKLETVGALTNDQSHGVVGQIGATAKTTPLTIGINRYNDPEKRVYHCRIANHKRLTPRFLEYALIGASLYLGTIPQDHMVEYNGAITLENGDTISFENVSSGLGLNEVLAECVGSVLLLMNNPFEEINIKSLEFNIGMARKNISAGIWSIDVSDTVVKAGENIKVEVIVNVFLADRIKYEFQMEIPQDLEPGKYQLIVCGAQNYERFLAKTVPYRFSASNMPDLIDALKNALNIPRDRLYCILILPPSGITLEKSELPDLPATKAMVLQNQKRTLRIQPYQDWVEKSVQTDTVISNSKIIQITVEK